MLVALARHFRAPVRLPENVAVSVVVVQKKDGSLSHRTVMEEITTTYDDLGMRCERDAFDTLFDHAPDKLQVVKKVNLHLIDYTLVILIIHLLWYIIIIFFFTKFFLERDGLKVMEGCLPLLSVEYYFIFCLYMSCSETII